MKLFLDYISKIKFYIILQLFPVMLAEIIFFLYQLPIEPMVYVTVFWLITGICACLNGFYRYRKKVEQLELIAAAPDINLSQMDSPVGQDERFQQEIMQQLNQMHSTYHEQGVRLAGGYRRKAIPFCPDSEDEVCSPFL